MNESVYNGGIRFNASVYGYVLSATIIYKQRVKVLSGVECLYTGEKALSIPRTVPGPFGTGRTGEKGKRIVLSRLSARKMLPPHFNSN